MSAIISGCGQYRYRLDRDVQPEGKVFAYFGINPSTADASIDDATVRKWRGFTLRNGGRKFVVGNVFTYRATDVREVGTAAYCNGMFSAEHIDEIIEDADVLVPCWGNSSKVPPALRPHIADLLKTLLESGKPVMHFGLTASGDPKHPLMLGYDTALIPWTEDLV
jgi:hypothetical protein